MRSFSKAALVALTIAIPAVAFGAEAGKTENGKVLKVNEVYKNKDSLDKQHVTVKGKVVKVSSGIMGRNWVHIQDGSGTAGKKDNDLTVTSTKDLPRMGQTVTATGTLAKNKDFGAGYFYTVILEDATIK